MPDLTTLVALKGWLAIPGGASATADPVLADLITSTSADFLRAIARPDLMQASYTEVREGDGDERIALRHWPITEVDQVTVGTLPVPPSANHSDSGYYFDADLDPERCNQLWMANGCFQDGAQVVIVYTAGYEDVPTDVAQAVLDWCAARYKGRPGTGINSSREAGGEHVTYDKEVAMPATTARVAERYTRDWPSTDRYTDDRTQRVLRVNRTTTTTIAAAAK